MNQHEAFLDWINDELLVSNSRNYYAYFSDENHLCLKGKSNVRDIHLCSMFFGYYCDYHFIKTYGDKMWDLNDKKDAKELEDIVFLELL